MLCDEVRATRMVALLLELGIKSANAMSKEEACKQYARITRNGKPFKGAPMNLAQLVAASAKTRRRKQTHRHKRNK